MARGKLPKWAIKKAGGINKKAWRLARRGRKSSPRRRSTVTRRRTPSTARRGPMRRQNFDLSLIDTASTVLIGSALLTTAAGGSGNPIDEIKIGAYQEALKDLAGNMRNRRVQGYVAKVAVGAILSKLAARKFKVRKIGGIKNIFSLTV